MGPGVEFFVAESDDLVHWSNYRRWPSDSGLRAASTTADACSEPISTRVTTSQRQRVLKRLDGHFWTLYGAYPLQGGYELPAWL